MSEPLRFQHLLPMQALIANLQDVNAAIDTGDLSSPKAALKSKWVADILDFARTDLTREGATDVNLDLYVAAGGWVGLTYSYAFADGFTFQGSLVPRKVR
jgi:hypothetical protein